MSAQTRMANERLHLERRFAARPGDAQGAAALEDCAEQHEPGTHAPGGAVALGEVYAELSARWGRE
jgi:hypothetical protein